MLWQNISFRGVMINVENNFIKIYVIMSIIGNLLGLGGVIYALSKGITSAADYSILLFVLLAALMAMNVIMLIKRKSLNKDKKSLNASIVKGHFSMMLGVCILVSAIMYSGGKAFSDVLVIVAIVLAFMSVMLIFMLSTFDKIQNVIQESEKK